MLEYFNQSIVPLNQKLGIELGTVERITINQIASRPKRIDVKYIKAINPSGEEVLVSESEMRRCEELGLSMRRVL